MKSAIIAGATGLVGRSVVRYFNERGINLLCIGRRKLSGPSIRSLFGADLSYVNYEEGRIFELPHQIRKIDWKTVGESVFYNFSWGGPTSLTDGDLSQQLDNVTNATEFLKVAKELGCSKFINAGSVEETNAEKLISTNGEVNALSGPQLNYAISKLASRDMCRILAYLEQIDYVHSRISIPIDLALMQGGYVTRVLRAIKSGEEYQKPISDQCFDLVSLTELAEAYYKIGLQGKNKADYYIEPGYPLTLHEIFRNATEAFNQREFKCIPDKRIDGYNPFSYETLQKDTGFKPIYDIHKMLGYWAQSVSQENINRV